MTLAKEGILDIHRSVLCTFRTSRFKIMNWIYRQCTGGLNYTTVLTKQHYITGSVKCSMKPLSKLLTFILSALKTGVQSYCDTSYSCGCESDVDFEISKDLLSQMTTDTFRLS